VALPSVGVRVVGVIGIVDGVVYSVRRILDGIGSGFTAENQKCCDQKNLKGCKEFRHSGLQNECSTVVKTRQEKFEKTEKKRSKGYSIE
jgi:hypothetical protein